MRTNNQSGLTLIELLIALAIAGMLLGGMIMAFTGQSKTYNTQQEIATLQEDMWAALQVISRDILHAGYDPAEAGSTVFGIMQATATSFRVTQDFDGSGTLNPATSPGENVLYNFVAPVAPATATSLSRSSNGVATPLIDNITQLNFEYEVITKNGSLPWTWTWKQNPTATERENIRVVRICMQGRTNRPTNTKDTSNFTPAFSSVSPNWTPATLGAYQYRTVCTEVNCRNLLD